MTAPANHEVGTRLVIEQACVSQDVEDSIGDRLRPREVKSTALDDFVGRVHHVAQHGKQ